MISKKDIKKSVEYINYEEHVLILESIMLYKIILYFFFIPIK